jgi:hypothetical protein
MRGSAAVPIADARFRNAVSFAVTSDGVLVTSGPHLRTRGPMSSRAEVPHGRRFIRRFMSCFQGTAAMRPSHHPSALRPGRFPSAFLRDYRQMLARAAHHVKDSFLLSALRACQRHSRKRAPLTSSRTPAALVRASSGSAAAFAADRRDLLVRRPGRLTFYRSTRVVDRCSRRASDRNAPGSASLAQCSVTSGCIHRRSSGDSAKQMSAEMTAMIAICPKTSPYRCTVSRGGGTS